MEIRTSMNYVADTIGYVKSEIVLHHCASVISDPTHNKLESIVSYLARKGLSVHYVVGGECVLQMQGMTTYAAACGNTQGNQQGIHIEMVNSSGSPDWRVSDKTLATTIELVRKIRSEYYPDRDMPVRQHCEYVPTLCPGPYIRANWDSIIERIGGAGGTGGTSTAEWATPKKMVRTYKRGMMGMDVQVIQTLLNGFMYRPTLVVDGNFGAKTDSTVRLYQTRNALEVDGVVGAKTWAAMLREYSELIGIEL